MKKIVTIIAFLIFINIFVLVNNSFAVSLDTLNLELNKEIVRPGEEVKLTIQFGQSLKEYSFNVFYDNNIFEYISSDGETANNTGEKVGVESYGNTLKTNMNITFKAKENITTSNPTELTVTAEKLVNGDGSITFDSILVPIVKNITVEPEYINYTLNLETKNDIIVNDEIPMQLSYYSPMGRYYEGARLIAEVSAPDIGALKMLALDSAGLEHDLALSGWGDPQGFMIGGKDVKQVLNITGIFSKPGEYTVKLKLIDRKNSDKVISENSFNFIANSENNEIMSLSGMQDVAEISLQAEEEIQNTTNTVLKEITNENSENSVVGSTENILNETNNKTKTENVVENSAKEVVPKKLPKTGRNMYIPIVFVVIAIIVGYVYYYHKEN